jgi:glycosyltransferase involved in cell wall biosynthesis
METSNSPVVSIIMAAYNAKRYGAQAIQSVLAQTYQHIELIIVNDGSTDDTLEMLESYKANDSRVVVINQANAGVSAARNAGFAHARGEYFCIFDADDLMLPTKIERQMAFAEAHPSADFIYSKVYYFMDGAYDIYRRDLVTVNGSDVYKTLLSRGNFIYTGTVFFKRSVFDRFGGFDATLRSAEEFDYWLTLSKQGISFMHQDEYLTLCRSRKDGLTSDSVTMYTTARTVLCKHLRTPFSKITSRQYIKTALLLFVSKLRKPSAVHSASQGAPTHPSGVRPLVNAAFVGLRRLKFSLTFKKISDKQLRDFLIRADSRTTI